MTLVIGISRDKEIAGILKILAPLASRVILTAAQNPRAADPTELRAHLPALEGEVILVASPREALSLARQDPAGITVVTGSLFLVADALAWCEKSLGH